MLRAPLGPAEAYMRMLAAFGEDLAATVTDHGERDPFALRDPVYIERTLPAVRLASQLYFRADVRGLAHIPPEGPVLLVGNHSGGTLIADTFVFGQHFYDRFGARAALPPARARPRVQGPRPARAARALRHGPGIAGEHGRRPATVTPRCSCTQAATTRPTVRRGSRTGSTSRGRTGFVELALKHQVPVVPVVAIGGQETALFLGQGRRLARALKLDRRFRLKVLPAAIGPPFGLTVLDLPGRIPLPAKISIRILKPIDLRRPARLAPDPEDGYKLVTSTMQRTLTRLSNERSLPVVG